MDDQEEEENNSQEEMPEQRSAARRCFSVVQSKRFGSPIASSTIALCPSMDLLTLSLEKKKKNKGASSSSSSSSSPPLWLHRSLSFQKLATVITNDEEDDTTDVTNNKNSSNNKNIDDSSEGSLMAVWSPDGRWLALTEDSKQRLTLYHVEALVQEATVSSSTVFSFTASSYFGTTDDDDDDESTKNNQPKDNQSYQLSMSGNAVRIQLTSHSLKIWGLAWDHVGRWHPLLQQRDMQNDDENEDQSHLYAKIRQRYADRSRMLLPASEYHTQYSGGGQSLAQQQQQQQQQQQLQDNAVVPSSQTPLSVLAVATAKPALDLYLNGRYRIASGLVFMRPDHNFSSTSKGDVVHMRAQIACSNDLAHILVAAAPSYYTVLTIPALAEQRYTLQALTALYSSIMGHFHALPTLLTEVMESWKSSVKPLDTKLEALSRLLRSYGLLPAPTDNGDAQPALTLMRRHFVRYILSGHVAGSADLSNAMDQFFTGVQMNDQLIQRMERSLTVAIANVESLFRKTISAAQALTLESDQLRGFARSSNELIPAKPAMELQHYCQHLLLAMESALTSLVDARFRLRDWIAWLRATGSQIKARGTASNSVQRENAKKRRVPDDTVRRILSYLQQEKVASKAAATTTSTTSLCETLLGIDFSQHWDTMDSSDGGNTTSGRPGSPQSVLLTDTAFSVATTIPVAFQKAFETAQSLFELPAASLKNSIHTLEFDLETLPSASVSSKTMAVTTRLGDGGLDEVDLPFGEDAPTGFFHPNMQNRDESTSETDGDDDDDVRQWGISAQVLQTRDPSDPCTIQIRAVPLPCYTVCTTHCWDDDSYNDQHFSWFAETVLQLPVGYHVVELAFYGDNGKSGLFAGACNGSGMERRQALGALVTRNDGEGDGCYLELWLIPYDRALWFRGDLALNGDNEGLLTKVAFASIPELMPTELVALVMGDEDEGEEEQLQEDETSPQEQQQQKQQQQQQLPLRCRTREIGKYDSLDNATSTRLVLSGYRGIAAVSTNRSNGTFLDIFDLEEDEEIEDGEEEMEEE